MVRSWPKRDGQPMLNARWPVREHNHLVSEKHALAQIVGDEHARDPLLDPQLEHDLPQVFAGEGIQRAKGLVQDKHAGPVNERTAQRGALAHAA